MTDRGTRIFMALPLLFAGLVPSIANAQQISEPLQTAAFEIHALFLA
jgi:hypothetical protein